MDVCDAQYYYNVCRQSSNDDDDDDDDGQELPYTGLPSRLFTCRVYVRNTPKCTYLSCCVFIIHINIVLVRCNEYF